MSNETKTIRGTAKDKITEVASELFYAQGYNATGIQQIIDVAGVSKGTFYTHFKSKEDLGLAYLQLRSNEEMCHLKKELADIKDPYQRYFDFNTMMKEWMISTGYRGCAFSNMAAEVTDGNSPIRKEAKYHYEAFRAIIKDMVEELLKSDKKYAKLDLDYVANQYMIIEIGALTNAEIYQDTWPYDQAAVSLKKLLEEKN